MFHRVLALLLLLQGIFANASRPPHHLELPNFFNRKTLSKNSNSGVAAQDLIAFGKKARKGQFPFIASLLKPSFSGAGFFHSCTGSLIASNLVLTAAHCFFNVTTGAWSPPTQVLLGGIDLSSSSNFRESIAPAKFLYPSTYSVNTFDSAGGDIGIIVLSTASKLFPVKLAKTAPGPGAFITAVGFGVDEKSSAGNNKPKESNRSLKYTHVRTSADACPSPPKKTICAVGMKQSGGNSGTCSGDSGGPQLNSKRQLVSVTSYGPNVDCGVADWAVYTSVADYYNSFIKPTIDKYAIDSGESSGGKPRPHGNGSSGSGDGSEMIEEEDDDSINSGSGTGRGCPQWSWDSVSKQKIIDGTPVSESIKVAKSSACGELCVATPACNSFNYKRRNKKCFMYEEGAEIVETVRDYKYVAGYLTCEEVQRKKKRN